MMLRGLKNFMNKHIAILGSTSHIAKGVISKFLRNSEFILHLYSRSPEKVRTFLQSYGKPDGKNIIINRGYSEFSTNSYDVIINCVGVGTMKSVEKKYSDYFMVTERYDNLIIEYLINNPGALYISFSSGAVYGRKFSAPAGEKTRNNIEVNYITTEDYYGIARLNAEAKHRSFKDLNIVDLRIFSYFSRFIDLTDGYFITEILNCILNKKILITSNINFTRDYLHPEDLYRAIRKSMDTGKLNGTFDITSACPVEKTEILDYFSSEYGLQYEKRESSEHFSPTGSKNIYCSNYNNASSIGYKPVFTSIDTIKEEAKYILKNNMK